MPCIGRRVRHEPLLLAPLLLISCGSSAEGPPLAFAAGAAGAGAEASGATSGAGGRGDDPSDALFDRGRVLDVEIELAEEDWAALRVQTRSLLDVVGESCLSAPPERPFTYFSGTVTIDGERMESVGVRKKGFFGSLSTTKPALRLKFDEYVDDREFAGLRRLTLNNAISDPSYVKQCIGYALFAAAGVPASRCSFAHVRVNGDDLGLYVNVEAIDKHFLARHFGSRDGNLYEGALSDFRPGWVDTFQKKTNEDDPDRSDLEPLVEALLPDDGAALGRVTPLVDSAEFTSFWAMEYLLMHADGYSRNTNNFYVYRDPTDGLWSFIPWGIDAILFPDMALSWEEAIPPGPAWVSGALSRRLHDDPEGRSAYGRELERLLREVWDAARIDFEIARLATLLRPHMSADESGGFEAAVQGVREFVAGRSAAVEAALRTSPEVQGPLREPLCIEAIGSVAGSFDTTFGTFGVEDPFGVGSGSASFAFSSAPEAFTAVSAGAGLDEESGLPAVRLFALAGASDLLILQLTLTDPADFSAGVSVPLDGLRGSGFLVRTDLSAAAPELEVVGLVANGTVDFDAAGTTQGAAVRGSISGAELFDIQ